MPTKWISETEAVLTNGLYRLCADADAMSRIDTACRLVEGVLEDHRESGDLLTSSAARGLGEAYERMIEVLSSLSSAHDHLLTQVLDAAAASRSRRSAAGASADPDDDGACPTDDIL